MPVLWRTCFWFPFYFIHVLPSGLMFFTFPCHPAWKCCHGHTQSCALLTSQVLLNPTKQTKLASTFRNSFRKKYLFSDFRTFTPFHLHCSLFYFHIMCVLLSPMPLFLGPSFPPLMGSILHSNLEIIIFFSCFMCGVLMQQSMNVRRQLCGVDCPIFYGSQGLTSGCPAHMTKYIK